MKWSWRLGRLFGIDINVHATFPILIVWVAVGAYQRTGTLAGSLADVSFILAVFGTVVLHELGHALTARRFGVGTKDITLLPIGGVARLERIPERPGQELAIALAGPAVNLVLAGVLFVLLAAGGQPIIFEDASLIAGGPILERLFWVNLFLAAFNMLPAFPMDGGRVLRALLALRGDYVRATRMAARLGQAVAFLLGLLGLFSNPFLVLVALFVWTGAAAEAGAVETRAALAGLLVDAAMITNFESLPGTTTVGVAAERLLAGSQTDFPVVDPAGRPVGVLTRTDLIGGLTRNGPNAIVSEVMTRQFATAAPTEMLGDALARLQTCECHSLPVVLGQRVVGMITMENIGEFMTVQTALRTPRQAQV